MVAADGEAIVAYLAELQPPHPCRTHLSTSRGTTATNFRRRRLCATEQQGMSDMVGEMDVAQAATPLQIVIIGLSITLNLTRTDMIKAGYSPSVRLFEAAACGMPIISDYWLGLETLFQH